MSLSLLVLGGCFVDGAPFDPELDCAWTVVEVELEADTVPVVEEVVEEVLGDLDLAELPTTCPAENTIETSRRRSG